MKMNVLLSTVAGLSLMGLMACQQQQPTAVPTSYKTLTVKPSSCQLNREYSATLKGEQSVEIRPQVSGTITRINVKEGANVSKGQVLFVIDQTPYIAALQTAKAQVSSAKASLANQQLTLKSKQQLYDQKIGSEYELKQAQNNVAEAKASLANAQAQELTAKNNLSYTEVKSPANGVIGLINYRVGALVSSQITDPLTEVADNHNIHAYFSITEAMLQELIEQYGSTAKALEKLPAVKLRTTSGSEYKQKGHIDAISGNVDKSTGSVSLRATFGNANGILRNGGNGTIILPYNINNKIIIPQEATYELQNKTFVYRIENGKTKSTEVQLLDQNDGINYVVIGGLKTGDRIVAEGAGLVREGTEVK